MLFTTTACNKYLLRSRCLLQVLAAQNQIQSTNRIKDMNRGDDREISAN